MGCISWHVSEASLLINKFHADPALPAGKQLAFLDENVLEQLLQQVEAANGLVDSCTKPGIPFNTGHVIHELQAYRDLHKCHNMQV